MPTYDYTCSTCHHLWEELKKINDPKTTRCPKCAEHTAERVINANKGGFILKGNGYYKPGGVV